VSVASWAGSNNHDPIYNNQGTSMYGRQNPGQAWQLFMNAYLANAPKAPMPTKQEVGLATPTTTAPSSPTDVTSSDTPTPTPTPTHTTTAPPTSPTNPPPTTPTPPPATVTTTPTH
jgi:membrane peptidoglycan carboxypeptidase